MEVVADSHAIFWYLAKNKKLSVKAQKTLNQASKIVVSTIVLLELLYLLQKYGEVSRFNEFLDKLNGDKYLVYPVDLALVKECAKLSQDLEMHDRLIVATAELFNAPLVSKDKEIKKLYPKTIW